MVPLDEITIVLAIIVCAIVTCEIFYIIGTRQRKPLCEEIYDLWNNQQTLNVSSPGSNHKFILIKFLTDVQIQSLNQWFFEQQIKESFDLRKPISINEKEYFVIELTSYYEFLKNSALGLKVLNLVQQYELENSQQSMEM